MAKAKVDLAKFELAQQLQDAGIDVNILDPLGEPTGIIIKICGPDSATLKAVMAEIRAERIAAGKYDNPSPEEQHAYDIRAAIACTVSWSEFESDGQIQVFSPDTARKIYTRHAFILEHVVIYLKTRAAYFLEAEKATIQSMKNAVPQSEDGAKT